MGGSIRPTSQMKSLRYLVQGAHQAVAKLGLKPSGLVGALQPIGVSWCPKLAVQVRGSAPCPRQSVPSSALAFHPERTVRSPRLILQDAAEPDAWGCGGRRGGCAPPLLTAPRPPFTGCALSGVYPHGPPPARSATCHSASQPSSAAAPCGPDAEQQACDERPARDRPCASVLI